MLQNLQRQCENEIILIKIIIVICMQTVKMDDDEEEEKGDDDDDKHFPHSGENAWFQRDYNGWRTMQFAYKKIVYRGKHTFDRV